MAISKLGGSTSDNWELISSVTPTAASAAVNFTGLSPYKKLMIIWNGVVLAASNGVFVRLNNDSSANYTYGYTDDTNTLGNNAYEINWSMFTTSVIISSSGTNQAGLLQFANCDMTGLKSIGPGGDASSGGENKFDYYGWYSGSSVVTQVNLLTTSTFTAVGTVYLYGVK